MSFVPSVAWPDKDPDELLDYDVDWGDRLGDDTIVSSIFTLVSGTVVLGTTAFSAQKAKCWLSGGTLGETCEIRNHITTAGNREMEQTVTITILKR